MTREDVTAYRDIVDAFGVGGAIANAPVIDFALDIVGIGGRPKAKRGKRSGAKQVYELTSGEHVVLPAAAPPPAGSAPLLSRYIENGRILQQPDMDAARELLAGKPEVLRDS